MLHLLVAAFDCGLFGSALLSTVLETVAAGLVVCSRRSLCRQQVLRCIG